MSVAGVIGLFRAPVGAVSDDGRMALVDHLRELRARVMRSVLVLLVALIVALFFYNQLLALVFNPYEDAIRRLPNIKTIPTIGGVGGPLLLQLKLAGLTAVVATCPYWLYQIWAFILPGLHPHEKRWSRVFVLTAGPLFIAGVLLGYYVLPKGIAALIGFTPAGLTQLTEFGEFFTFITRMLLVFGVAFEIPLFVVLLNLAGLVSGQALGRHRPVIIVGVFVFAAVATPSTDPYSMLMLAFPMLALVLLSEVVARILDRRKRARAHPEWDDDTASPL